MVDIIYNTKIKIVQILKDFMHLPKFSDGRIDYTNASKAPVLSCFVKFQDKFLLLKRSKKVNAYPEKWNILSGFIDEIKPLHEKVLEELEEELRILKEDISYLKINNQYEYFDQNVNKTWIIYPVLVELKQKPDIKLDWEHTEFKWVYPEEIKKYDIIHTINKSLKKI